jgi:hypothetical protein
MALVTIPHNAFRHFRDEPAGQTNHPDMSRASLNRCAGTREKRRWFGSFTSLLIVILRAMNLPAQHGEYCKARDDNQHCDIRIHDPTSYMHATASQGSKT